MTSCFAKSIRIYDTNAHPSHTILSFRHQQNPTNQYFVFTGFPSDLAQQSPPSYWQPQLLQGITVDSSVTQTTTHANVVKALTCYCRRSCHRLCSPSQHNSLCSWGHLYSSGPSICMLCCNVERVTWQVVSRSQYAYMPQILTHLTPSYLFDFNETQLTSISY